MTLQGTITKLAYHLGGTCVAFVAAYCPRCVRAGNAGVINGMTWGGLFGGIVVAVILMLMRPPKTSAFDDHLCGYTGMFVGSVSLLFEAFYNGIVLQAALTLFITGSMLFLSSK